MLKLEQIYFGKFFNKGSHFQFPLTMYEQVNLKYCATLTIQGITIEPLRWYIRSDNMHELYIESHRMVRHLIKLPYVDVAVLLFSQQINNHLQWYYYRPLVIYK